MPLLLLSFTTTGLIVLIFFCVPAILSWLDKNSGDLS